MAVVYVIRRASATVEESAALFKKNLTRSGVMVQRGTGNSTLKEITSQTD